MRVYISSEKSRGGVVEEEYQECQEEYLSIIF